MIHYNTTNDSAIKMAYLLGEMGVTNNKFFLRLDNPDLLHIDPFSEDLTDFQKASINYEIVNNPWYYFREIVRIPAGGGLVKFEFHRGTIALIWAVLNNISSFVVWPRQTYKTTTMCCIYSYMFYWGSIHNKIVIIAHEDAIVKKNLQGIKDIRDNLPPYLNLYDKSDRDNEKEMYNKSNNNRITCRAPARNEDGARKAGRGLTTAEQWFDEIAFIKYISAMYDSISFAFSKASADAKMNGAPHHQIMSTTAGFLNTDEGVWAHNFLNNCADFTEKFYDYEDIEIVKTIILNSSNSGFIDISFMYYDLGKDENYLDEQKKRLITSSTPKDTLDREVLNKWKDISTEHPLGQDRIERLNGLIRSPTDIVIINDTYSIRLYVDVDEFDCTKKLIGGMDLGGNLKGDFSTLVVIDPTDFKVVAVLRSNSQSTTLFSLAIITIMVELFQGLVLFPERNYNGAIIDNIVTHLPNGLRRVYHESEGVPGLFNSKKVRPILFNMILKIAVDEYGDRICDKTIISEISGLIRTRNGRIDHKQGKHDDTLVAYLLALYFILYVSDIGKYIDKSLILSNFSKNELINNLSKINKATTSNKLKMLDNKIYDNFSAIKNVNSIDDIADIVFTNSKYTKSGTKSSISKYSGDIELDDDEETGYRSTIKQIEDSDSLEEVRGSISKIKEEDSSNVKEINIDGKPSTTRKDFRTIFGW